MAEHHRVGQRHVCRSAGLEEGGREASCGRKSGRVAVSPPQVLHLLELLFADERVVHRMRASMEGSRPERPDLRRIPIRRVMHLHQA